VVDSGVAIGLVGGSWFLPGKELDAGACEESGEAIGDGRKVLSAVSVVAGAVLFALNPMTYPIIPVTIIERKRTIRIMGVSGCLSMKEMVAVFPSLL